jgi:hypothetical protein
LGMYPPLSRPGKSGTPWERTHWTQATAVAELAAPPAVGEPPGSVDDGLLQAAASRARPAVAAMATAARGRRGHGSRGAGQDDCAFMAVSVPAGDSGRITRRG